MSQHTPKTDAPDHGTDAMIDALLTLHARLPRQGPGSAATTRRLLTAAGPLPAQPRILDAGCGSGPAALLLAAEAGAVVTAVDLHQPYLDELAAEADRRGLADRISVVRRSMDRLPFPDRSFDVVWAEGSVYTIGFDTALRLWRRLLVPDGVLAITEIEWTRTEPDTETRAYWEATYRLRTHAENTHAARVAGYRVHATGHSPNPTGGVSTTRRSPSECRRWKRIADPGCTRRSPH